MAVAKLYYGGETYKLEEAAAAELQTRLVQAYKSDDEFSFLTVVLANGGELGLAVSRSIPVAIEYPDSDRSVPKAVFL